MTAQTPPLNKASPIMINSMKDFKQSFDFAIFAQNYDQE